MKIFSVLICILCTISLLFGLSACGSDEAKVSGIYVSVVIPDDDNYSDALADGSTAIKNAYALQVGNEYDLTIEYCASGGSKYPILTIDDIVLRYNTDIFKITRPAENHMQVARFKLTCKYAVDYSAVLIEVREYSHSVIISAN